MTEYAGRFLYKRRKQRKMKSASSLWASIRSIAPRLDGLTITGDATLRQVEGTQRMLQHLMQGQERIMLTVTDIKTAEQAQGAKIDALMALTDEIFQRLQSSPVSQDPAIQEVLDMISNHNTSMDATIARDTPADPGTTAPATGADTPTE